MAPRAKTYEYAVRDRAGKVVKGRIEASNQAAVANRLRTMGTAPVCDRRSQHAGLKRELNIPGLSDRVRLRRTSRSCRGSSPR